MHERACRGELSLKLCGLTGALEPYDRPGKTNLFRTLVFFLQPTAENADDFWGVSRPIFFVPSFPPPHAVGLDQPGRYAAFLFTRIHNFWV